jgi:hypothetical protein
MTAKTPKSIKVNVIKEWLQGIPRNEIANNNGIGAGTVTDIHQRARNNDVPDIVLLRELAIKLKKENLDLSYFASAVRLKKVLDRIELPEDKMELLLEEIDVRCFRRGIGEKEFVSRIDETFDWAVDRTVPISDIHLYIGQKTTQLKNLDMEIAKRENRIRQQLEEENLTISDLNEYRLNRPLADKIGKLEKKLNEKESEVSLLREGLLDCQSEVESLKSPKCILEDEIIQANKDLPKDGPIEPKELSILADEIFYNPSRYTDIIKLMRQRFPKKPVEKTEPNLYDRGDMMEK